jgi:hypothetical protein
MNDGILCEVTLQCGVAPKVEYHDCWGLIDNDQFVLIHANDKAAWVECGSNAIPITLENDEIAHRAPRARQRTRRSAGRTRSLPSHRRDSRICK